MFENTNKEDKELYLKTVKYLESTYMAPEEKFEPISYITKVCDRLRYIRDVIDDSNEIKIIELDVYKYKTS